MAKIRMTERFILGAKNMGKPQADYFDEQVPGLCLRVAASGRKSWCVVYTSPETNRRARSKIGTHPELSLAQARAKVINIRAQIAEGFDPQVAKNIARENTDSVQTISSLIDDYFKLHVNVKALKSADQMRARFNRNVIPVIGDVRLAVLHRRDIAKAINNVIERGSLTEANRTFEMLRALVRWSVGQGILEHNIMEVMRRPAPTNIRTRVLSSEEIKLIWDGLDKTGMSKTVRDIIRLLFYTACRLGEISGLERSEVDLDNRLIVLGAQRVKNGREHKIPLTDGAIKILERSLAANSGKWVFPNMIGTGPTSNYVPGRAINRARERLGVLDWTAQDIRRSWATIAGQLGVPPHVIAAALNHVSVNSGVTFAHYMHHDYLPERREGYDLVATRIESIVIGRE